MCPSYRNQSIDLFGNIYLFVNWLVPMWEDGLIHVMEFNEKICFFILLSFMKALNSFHSGKSHYAIFYRFGVVLLVKSLFHFGINIWFLIMNLTKEQATDCTCWYHPILLQGSKSFSSFLSLSLSLIVFKYVICCVHYFFSTKKTKITFSLRLLLLDFWEHQFENVSLNRKKNNQSIQLSFLCNVNICEWVFIWVIEFQIVYFF